jgi:hypothetical protein
MPSARQRASKPAISVSLLLALSIDMAIIYKLSVIDKRVNALIAYPALESVQVQGFVHRISHVLACVGTNQLPEINKELLYIHQSIERKV